jgi:uncharacterized membrane protein
LNAVLNASTWPSSTARSGSSRGVALYAATLGVTFVVNLPLNDALAAVGDLGALPAADLAAARAAFESRGSTANGVQTRRLRLLRLPSRRADQVTRRPGR